MKKVISIVEDEKDLNELVKRYLEREGYEVRSYLTFDEASVHSTDEDVHLWILDIMLGDKSGFDLIDEIRACNPDVPVIFMSARDKEFDRIIGLERAVMTISQNRSPLRTLYCVSITSCAERIKRILHVLKLMVMK